MPLNFFYTMVQKSQKWPKTQIKWGPALSQLRTADSLRETFHIRVFLLAPPPHWSPGSASVLCSVDGHVKISTSGVAAGAQAMLAPGAFAFKPGENRNFGAIIREV